jgi:hypothetical protein
MKKHIALTAISALGFAAAAADAQAQATQVVSQANLGVRFAIPASWEWRDRDRDVFVNCAPKIESRKGMPGCYFTVQKSKLAPGQMAIADADRAKWKKWATAEGMRPFVSSKDLKVAGYDAHEILVREGNEKNAALSMRLFVLIPGVNVVDVMHYAFWDDKDQSAATRPAVRTALETLKPAK